MTDTQHSPAPWALADSIVAYNHIIDANGKVIAKIEGTDNPQEWLANARHISSALDTHHALLRSNELIIAAQKAICLYLQPTGPDWQDLVEELIELFDGPAQREIQSAVTAALKKARGE